MPQRCRTCDHPNRADIDRALGDRISVSALAAAWGLSRQSVQRHKQSAHHLSIPEEPEEFFQDWATRIAARPEPQVYVPVAKPKFQTKVHIVIPDTQVGADTPQQHLAWAGQFIADEYDGADLTVVHVGDHHTMDSLSTYDAKGGGKMEGRRYIKDIDAGNDGWETFIAAWRHVVARRIFLMGNHEYRINRAAERDAQLLGLITTDHLQVVQDGQWEVHDFLSPVTVDGVTYAHYFVGDGSSRPIGGTVENMLKNVGSTFTQGHRQGLRWGRLDGIAKPRLGLVAGSFYIHDEDYLTAQVTQYWRGILVCHNVHDGDYDLMQVSLDYLCRRYEGMPISEFKERYA